MGGGVRGVVGGGGGGGVRGGVGGGGGWGVRGVVGGGETLQPPTPATGFVLYSFKSR